MLKTEEARCQNKVVDLDSDPRRGGAGGTGGPLRGYSPDKYGISLRSWDETRTMHVNELVDIVFASIDRDTGFFKLG